MPSNLVPVDRGGGQPLPGPVRQQMEAALGADFSDVRVHVGTHVSSIGAHAFTYGSSIHFAPGQYDPHTSRGRQLLGHELAHVLQQRAGRVTNPFPSGVAVVQDDPLEAEADRMGRRAAAHHVKERAVVAATRARSPRLSLQRKLTIRNDDGLGKSPYEKLVVQLPTRGAPKISNRNMQGYLAAYPPDLHRRIFETLNAWAQAGDHVFDNWPEALKAAAAPMLEEIRRAEQSRLEEIRQRSLTRAAEYENALASITGSLPRTRPVGALPETWPHGFPAPFNRLPTELLVTILDYALSPRTIGHPSLGEARFLGDARSWGAVRMVNSAFRRTLSDWAANRNVPVNPGALNAPPIESFQLDQWAAVGESIVSQFPPDSHIYVTPGASMIPVVAFIRQQHPSAIVLHIPVSGLSRDAMEREQRKPPDQRRDLRPERLGPFYWAYLNACLPALRRGERRLLLMDYAPSGTTLNLMFEHIAWFLEDVGIPNPKSLIKLFKLQATTSLPGISSQLHGRLGSQWLHQLTENLKNERFKTHNRLVLYERKKDFTGEIERQEIASERISHLWHQVRKYLEKYKQ